MNRIWLYENEIILLILSKLTKFHMSILVFQAIVSFVNPTTILMLYSLSL